MNKVNMVFLSSAFFFFGIVLGQQKNNSLINSFSNRTVQPDEIFTDDNFEVYNFKQFEMTIVSIHDNIDFVYEPFNAKPFGILAKEKDFRYVVNSTYFAGTTINATHCGWLKLYGNTVVSKKMKDRQLQYIVQYNKQTKMIFFFSCENFTTVDDTNSLEFQTGPLVVENDSLAKQPIISSINGMRKASRTLLASTDNNHIYFITVRKAVQLVEIGNYLLSLAIFDKKKLDVINLDGGPSTSLYSKNNPELNFKTDNRLPFLLGVK